MANPGTTCLVSGDIETPGSASATGGQVEFHLSSWDTDGTQTITTEPQIVQVTADGTISVPLWRNARGQRNTFYTVLFRTPDSIHRPLMMGQIRTPDADSADLQDLLANFIATEPLTPTLIARAEAAALQASDAAAAAADYAAATAADRAQTGLDAASASASAANALSSENTALQAAIAAGAQIVPALTAPVPADGTVEILQEDAGLRIYTVVTGAWVAGNFVTLPSFDTVQQLLASTASTFGGTGMIIEAGGFRYEEAASDAADHHLTTAGGVKLLVFLKNAGNPLAWGIFDDPLSTQDQSASVQNWLDGMVRLGIGPSASEPLTLRCDSTVIYAPGHASAPALTDFSGLTVNSTAFPGFVIGDILDRFTGNSPTVRCPNVIKRGTVTWAGDTTAARLGNETGLLLINFAKCKIHLPAVRGFTNGVVYHSENWDFSYNEIYGGRLEDNQHNEILRCVRGAQSPGAEFVNENIFVGGYRRENSGVNALGNAYGTVFVSGTNAYRGSNNNHWKKPGYEMGSSATATYRCPVLLDGCGYANTFEDARHEGGRGPFGIAIGSASNTVAGTNNIAHVGYQAGVVAQWRSGWLQVNGAFANLHRSSLAEPVTWHSGPLANLLSSGGAANSPRVGWPFFLMRANLATPLRQGTVSTDLTTNNLALQVNPNIALMVEIDTTRVKDFRIKSAALDTFGGRLLVICFDAAGVRLTGDATDAVWGDEAYAKFSPTQTATGIYGGGYLASNDNGTSDRIVTFRSEVARAWVGYAGATKSLAINGMAITAYPNITTQASSALTASQAIAISSPLIDGGDDRLASAKPDTAGVHGKYAKGQMIGNSAVASGQPMGWVVSADGWLAAAWAGSTAYAVPGHCVTNDSGKIYALKTAGTSAASGGPTGTGSAISDGSCVWQYIGTAAVFLAAPNVP